jgi:beta-lactamase class A
MKMKRKLLACALMTGWTAVACTQSAEVESVKPTASPTTSSSANVAKIDIELQRQIEEIAAEAKGKVGVSALLIETGETAGVNSKERFPMQSVYKLPIAMAVMKQIEDGKLGWEQMVEVTRADFVSPGQRSPLRDKNPKGTKVTVEELVRLAVSESDGTASDVLLRIAGGPQVVQGYLTEIGIEDIKVVNTEKEFAQDWQAQYNNWATPEAAVELLRGMREWVPGADNRELLLHKFMRESPTGPNRLKGLLPKGTTVMHKTGTSGSRNGITAATNDIGIIYTPNDRYIAIAVFVADSPADEKTRDAVIAKIAKAVWDRWAR